VLALDTMTRPTTLTPVEVCHCMAVRQAARWISQLYDQQLAGCGLTSTQYAVLSHLQRAGPASVAQVAETMVMDRTTLTRNVAPLERDGLVKTTGAEGDRRRKVLTVTPAGTQRLAAARPLWRKAQAAFERHFGADQAAAMRTLLRQVPHGRKRD
jgi:DNA-binding MarR family transcriptional regulator